MGKISDPSKLATRPGLRDFRVLRTEEETLELLMKGHSVSEIACIRGRAQGSVKAHISSLKKKLRVKNLVSLGATAALLDAFNISAKPIISEGLPTGLK